MPQACDELRAQWTEETAVAHLESAGFILTAAWEWSRPSFFGKPSADDFSAAAYMCFEWDYGMFSVLSAEVGKCE